MQFSYYEKALLYIPNDPLVLMLQGYCYLFDGQIEKGKENLKKIVGKPFLGSLHPDVTPQDYLDGKVSPEGIKILFDPVDETRESILTKQKKLQSILTKYPQFRDGHFSLAVTYLQLGRGAEGMQSLLNYHHLDPFNPTVEYYLSVLCTERYQYSNAWKYLENTEKILAPFKYTPPPLKQIQHHLRNIFPRKVKGD